MPNRYRPYEESLQEALRDPREAAEYLNACLRDGSPEVFVLALRQVIESGDAIRQTLHHDRSEHGARACRGR